MDMPDPDGALMREAEEDMKAWRLMWDQIDMAHAAAIELSLGGEEIVTASEVLDALAMAGLQLTPAEPLHPVPSDYKGFTGTLISAAYLERVKQLMAGCVELSDDRWWIGGEDAD